MNKDSWKVKPFEKCIKKIIYTNKIKRENYLSNGKYPIISQDDSLISGYWEKEQDVFYVDTPLVIFGDHTRILKYIDFNFVLGADGVKILLPKDDLIAKFFYYYLVWYNIPNLGYSRHYKLLKEIEVLIPPIAIQEQIVKELDTLSDIITKKKEQLAELDKLAQATFYDMFGDPVENEKNWELKKLDEICTKITDGTHTSPKFLEKGIPFLFVSNIQNNELNFNTQKYISTEEYERLTRNTKIEQWDLLYTSVGSFGNPAIIKTNEKFCFQRHIAHLKPKHKIINIIFFHAVMKIDYVKHQANRLAIGVAQKTLNLSAIKKIVIPNPPISLQNQFAEKIEAIEQQKELINQSITDVQLLFDYTMDKYFN